LLHYLDDFFSANTDLHKCAKDMEKIKEVFKALGVPLAEDKKIGPKQVVFLSRHRTGFSGHAGEVT